MFDWIRGGLATGRRHRRLVWVVYLASLIPALLWACAAFPILSGAFGDRPFGDGLLGAGSFQVWTEYAASDDFQLGPLAALIPLLLGVAWLLQILVSAGCMNVLLNGDSGVEGSFVVGVRRFGGRFLRSALAFGLMLVPVVIIIGAGSRLGRNWAESSGNGYLRLGFFVASLAVAFFLFVLVDLAYDLSRLSAVAWDGRQTFRGYFRALMAVLRQPRKLLGMYLGFVGLIASTVLVYQLLRGSFAAASAFGIFFAFLLQQLSMWLRSYFQVSLLAGEVSGYRALGSSKWCRGHGFSESSEPSAEIPTAVPTSEVLLS